MFRISFCSLFIILVSNAFGQVSKDGLVLDEGGNMYIAIHAPYTLTFDGFELPISKVKTNFILKLDADGNFSDIEALDALADMMGPVEIKGDSLFIAQSIFIPAEKAKETYEGELVLTKLHTSLDFESTVTIPLPYWGRPLAFDYAKNYWYVAYAFQKAKVDASVKPKLAIAGIHQSYKDGWIKQYDVRTLSQVSIEDDSLYALGTFYYKARLGQHGLESSGTDFFLTNVDKTTGQANTAKSGSTGEVFFAAGFISGNPNLLAGTRLQTEGDKNSTTLFLTKLFEDFTPTGELLNNSKGIASCTSVKENTQNMVFAAGNFDDELTLNKTTVTSNGHQDTWVLMADAKLELKWIINLGSPLDDELIALEPTPDGGVVVAYQHRTAGYANVINSFVSAAPRFGFVKIVKLDANGKLVWEKDLKATYSN